MKALSLEQIRRRLAFDNPWWAGGTVDEEVRAWPRRDYFQAFSALVRDTGVRRAVVLMGPRRVGKTVMLQQLVDELLEAGTAPSSVAYVSLDTPTYLELSLEELVLLYFERFGHDRSSRVFVLLDEVQYRKDWEIHLKSLVDSFPRARFVVSGSAAAALRMKSRESGAGRFTEFVLPPLTFAEFLRFTGTDALRVGADPARPASYDIGLLNRALVDYLNFGAFPEAALSPSVRRDPQRYIRNDIIDKVLLRDLPSLYGIEDVQELYRLFTTLAFNTGSELSLEALSQRSGVGKITLRRYLEYLEAAFLIRTLHRVGEQGQRFQRATGFKVYLANPAMRAALFGPVDEDDEAMGPMVETAIVSQLAHTPPSEGSFAFARWKEGREEREVDIVWLTELLGPFLAMEVKWSDRAVDRPEELRGLLTFARRNPRLSRLEVTTRTRTAQLEVDGATLSFAPSSWWCLHFGRYFSALRAHEGLSGALRAD